MYIDTHTHLRDTKFDSDREAMLARAKVSGVSTLIDVGCDPTQWEGTLALCREHKNIYCALGIHPNDVYDVSEEQWATLATLARDAKVVAIGETGLDYHYDRSRTEAQKTAFVRHAELAQALNKPLIVHCREAYQDMFPLLEGLGSSVRGVIHCFSGGLAEAEQLTKAGWYLGIDGPVTYPKSQTLCDVVRSVPLERLLLETDCPYLPPQQYRGQRNEPAYLPQIAAKIAELKDIAAEEVGRITTKNAQTLFRIPS